MRDVPPSSVATTAPCSSRSRVAWWSRACARIRASSAPKSRRRRTATGGTSSANCFAYGIGRPMLGGGEPLLQRDPRRAVRCRPGGLVGEREQDVARLLRRVGDRDRQQPRLVLRVQRHPRCRRDQPGRPLPLDQLRLEPIRGLLDGLVAEPALAEQRPDEVVHELVLDAWQPRTGSRTDARAAPCRRRARARSSPSARSRRNRGSSRRPPAPRMTFRRSTAPSPRPTPASAGTG